MPYFQKAKTEIIRLADVDYEMDDAGEVVKQNGKPKIKSRVETGQTLEVVRRDTPAYVRELFATRMAAAQSRAKRIEMLQKQMVNPDTPHEKFLKLEGEIKELSAGESQFQLMCGYVAESLKSWDYYATQADFDNGKPVELSAEAILNNCDIGVIGQVIDFLGNQTEQESSEGKELPAISPNGSSQKVDGESVQSSTASIS